MNYEKLKFLIWNNAHALSAWQIKIWQVIHYRNLIHHTCDNIPLYRKLWRKQNISKKIASRLENISLLPIVSKEHFLNSNLKEYVYNYSPHKQYLWLSTSGSTGKPFTFIFPQSGNGAREIERLYIAAKRWRFLDWNGVPFNKILLMKVFQLRKRNWAALPGIGVTSKQLRDYPKEIIKQAQNLHATALFGYVSRVVEFCMILREYNMVGKIHFPYCVTTGEILTNVQRVFIEETLACEVYNIYALKEFFGAVGNECKEHNGFHLSSESLVLEIVDEYNNIVSAGTKGRIVITNLFNKIMPFIRYDTGDVGMLLPQKCTCGLETPLFKLEGRTNTLNLGAKNLYYGDVNGEISKYANSMLQWQIKKLSDNNIEFLFIKGPLYNSWIKKGVENSLKRLLGETIRVSIKSIDKMELTEAGKTNIFINTTPR